MIIPVANNYHFLASDDHASPQSDHTQATEKFGKPVRGLLPTIIRTFKAAVSRQAKQELGMVKIWQRNYYEHIVRDENEFADIFTYITTNPPTWADEPDNIL
jgi:putative transposase